MDRATDRWPSVNLMLRLSALGFLVNFQPSEPFLAQYLTENKGLSETALDNLVWPVRSAESAAAAAAAVALPHYHHHNHHHIAMSSCIIIIIIVVVDKLTRHALTQLLRWSIRWTHTRVSLPFFPWVCWLKLSDIDEWCSWG